MRFSNLQIRSQYPIIIVALSLLSAALIGTVSYIKFSQELQEVAEAKLVALRDARVSALNDRLTMIRTDLELLAHDPTTQGALDAFNQAWSALPNTPSRTLQDLYIEANPHPVGAKDALNQADDDSAYSAVHGIYHPWFRRYLKARGYYDLFLFSPDGDLIYTVFKERDYATNFLTGPWKDTPFADGLRAAMANPDQDHQVFVDFVPYAPSYDAPASFILAPVHDAQETFVGVLAFQMPVGRINELMQSSAGMGETGETYIVGHDLLMRSAQRSVGDTSILTVTVNTIAAGRALNGETGVTRFTNRTGADVFSAYAPLEFLGTTWAVLADVDASEVLMPARHLRLFVLIAAGVIFLVVAAIGVRAALHLSRPIISIARAMEALAKGDTQTPLPDIRRGDEIGRMAATLATFQQNIIARGSAEADLAGKEAQLRNALDFMPGGIFMVNSQKMMTLVNKQYLSMTGLTEAQVQAGMSASDLAQFLAETGQFGPGDQATLAKDMAGRLTDGTPKIYERQVNSDLAIEATINPTPDGEVVVVVTDITERYRARAQLEQTQRNFQNILASSPVGVVIITPDNYERLYMNQRFLEMFGAGSEAEFAAAAQEDSYADPADFAMVRARLAADEPVVAVEVRRKRLDGSIWWCLVTRTLVNYDGHEAFLNWHVDITEQKIAQEQLQKIVADAPVSIVVLGCPDNMIVDVNHSFAELVGRDPAQMKHTAMADYLFAEDIDDYHAMESLLRHQGSFFDKELRVVDMAGKPIWCLLSMTSIQTLDGERQYLAWYYRIQKRKEAEERLKQSERHLLSILETSPIGVGLTVGGKPVFTNTRMLDLLGRTREEYLYHDAKDLYVDPDQRPRLMEELTEYDEIRDREIAFKLPDGSTIDALTTFFKTEYDGAPASLVWLYDISERKEMERELTKALRVIHESVAYASNIQGSLLPGASQFNSCTSEHFVIWQPRDVVGGDIVWLRPCDGGHVLIVCDCTGHGVPGAFMTLIGTTALNQALTEHRDGRPEHILASMNRHVKQVLKQDTEEALSDDGMELAVCKIHETGDTLTFAGARFSLFQMDGATLTERKGDRSGIGYRRVPMDQTFTPHVIENASAYCFYLTTDGIIDQIGGEKRRAHGKKRLMKTIEANAADPLLPQSMAIYDAFSNYQGTEPRRDDVTLVGFRPKG